MIFFHDSIYSKRSEILTGLYLGWLKILNYSKLPQKTVKTLKFIIFIQFNQPVPFIDGILKIIFIIIIINIILWMWSREKVSEYSLFPTVCSYAISVRSLMRCAMRLLEYCTMFLLDLIKVLTAFIASSYWMAGLWHTTEQSEISP